MAFAIRNYDHDDTAPIEGCGAVWFDYETLEFRRGSTLCGPSLFQDDDGNPAAMVLISTAPEGAWSDGRTEPWDTCIFFGDRAGAKTAHRVARWLLRGDPRAPLLIEGSICLHVGEQHAGLPCWRRLAEEVPPLFLPSQEVQAYITAIRKEGGPSASLPNAVLERQYHDDDKGAFIAWFEGRPNFTPDDWALLLVAALHFLPSFSDGGAA